MKLAYTRAPATSLVSHCELTFLDRQAIDFNRITAQHHNYCNALLQAGLDVTILPALETLPDSVFVEDAAIVLDEIAILSRPGAISRRGEIEAIRAPLATHRARIASIVAPGTLDGGDVLRLGRTLFVGESTRTNFAGIEQLRLIVGAFGYGVQSIPTRNSLHLKTACSALDDATLLVNPDWIDTRQFEGYTEITVDPREPFAANILIVNDQIIVDTSHPRTLERIARYAAISSRKIIPVDISEFGKAEAGLTCLSLIFDRCTQDAI